MNTEPATDPVSAAHDVVAQHRDVHLEARDLATLILFIDDLRRKATQSFTIDLEGLRALCSKIDVFEGLSTVGSERRLTESINRLLKADCIARADMSHIKNAEQAEYQLTVLGEAMGSWHIQQMRFDGEPLGAILAAFNVQLNGIYEATRSITTDQEWRASVAAPMQYVVRELLSAVQRHQGALDAAHKDIRAFIPSLLKESSEASIERCKDVLDSVMQTIRDLVHVTMDISNTAFGLLDRIEVAGEAQGRPDAVALCEDIRRRLESVTDWTNQRHLDWGKHFDTVHSYLRFVVMVDRSRKVTDALKSAVSEVPTWSMYVANAPRLMTLRDRPPLSTDRPTVRRPRQDFQARKEDIAPDRLPEHLQELAIEHLKHGCARWTDIVAIARQEATGEQLIAKLPEIMQFLLRNGQVNDGNRKFVHLSGGWTLEELEVTKP